MQPGTNRPVNFVENGPEDDASAFGGSAGIGNGRRRGHPVRSVALATPGLPGVYRRLVKVSMATAARSLWLV